MLFKQKTHSVLEPCMRQKIILVARCFFNVKGFNETTVEDVTNLLCISLETFKLYFHSKDDLLEAVWSE